MDWRRCAPEDSNDQDYCGTRSNFPANIPEESASNTNWNSQLFRGHSNQPIRDRSLGLHISWGGNKNPNDLHHVMER
jgi:hypothetical protein